MPRCAGSLGSHECAAFPASPLAPQRCFLRVILNEAKNPSPARMAKAQKFNSDKNLSRIG